MSNELTHYGVTGMKWGVRRYQKRDGSLTSAGKKRAKLRDKFDKVEKSKIDKTKRLVDTSNDAVNKLQSANRKSQKKTRMDLSNMTDKELRDRINRYNLEKQYNDIFSTPQVNKGQKYTNAALSAIGTTLTITSSALGIALAIKELKS